MNLTFTQKDLEPYLAIFKRKLLQKPLKWKNARKMPNIGLYEFNFIVDPARKPSTYLQKSWQHLRKDFPWLPKKTPVGFGTQYSSASIIHAGLELEKIVRVITYDILLRLESPPFYNGEFRPPIPSITGAAGLIGRIPTPEEFDKLFRFGFAFRVDAFLNGRMDRFSLEIITTLEIKSELDAEMMKMHSFIPLGIRKELALEELYTKLKEEEIATTSTKEQS